MKKETNIPNNSAYQPAFQELELLILSSKQRVWQHINEEQIYLYCLVGAYVSAKLADTQWGQAVVSSFAKFLKHRNPAIKGFDRRAIYRMVQFFKTYSHPDFVAALPPQITQLPQLPIVGAMQPQLITAQIMPTQVMHLLTKLSCSAYLEILSGCASQQELIPKEILQQYLKQVD
ncbi:MAG: hypothetical protein RIS47_478 [Bacteroidota bacterium]|jgi:hypothetical protein